MTVYKLTLEGGGSVLVYEPVRYETVEERRFSEDIGSYTVFGIRAIDKEGNEIRYCADVSPCEVDAKRLCDMCNAFQLSPLHLLDFIEDNL